MHPRVLKAQFVSFLFLAATTALGGSASFAAIGPMAGKIDAQFGIQHDGSAVYAVPIEVPPGTGGMQPELSLVYQSGAPDGPLGLGWRLEGLEKVVRCPPTLAQDGFNGAIDYTATDRFCLDGERLVAIAGAYGAPGTVYHTERETRIRVTSHGTCGAGPCWFELVQKDGTVLEMGKTPDARALRDSGPDVRSWAASAHRDRNGNTLRVEYFQDAGALYPSKIRYTENGDLTAGREVSFDYSARTPSVTRYSPGAAVSWGQAMTAVRTSVDGSPVRTYLIDYDNLAGRWAPRIESLRECGSDGSCLPPTTFGWTSSPTTIESYAFNSSAMDFGHDGFMRTFADVNGDGRPDFCRAVGTSPNLYLSCALAGENGWSGELSSAPGQRFDFGRGHLPQVFRDVNGDGRADFCRAVGDSPNIFLSCALAGENGFGGYDFNSAGGFDFGHDGSYPRAFADADGDGRADFCRAKSLGASIVLACALAGDTGFTGAELTSTPHVSFDFGYLNMPHGFYDVNGDGRADFCRAVGDSPNIFLSCAFSDEHGFRFYDFNSAPSFDWGHAGYPKEFADVNGDGRTDYCRAVGDWPNIFFACALAKSSGFGANDFTSDWRYFDFGHSNLPRTLADADGDGRADFCRFVGDSPNIFLSCAVASETGFELYDLSSAGGLDLGYGEPKPSAFLSVVPGGGLSFCRAVGDAPNVFLSCTSPPTRRERVESIVDGYGQRIDIAYAPLDDRNVYTPSAGAVYPTRDVRGGAKRVVASYTRSSVASSAEGDFSYTYSYAYGGARSSSDGRGWQGFREIVRRDHDLGLVTTSRLLQDFPLTGMAESDTLSCDPLYGRDPACPHFADVHRTTRTYQVTAPFAGVSEVLSRETLVEALEYGAPGSSTRQIFDHDTFGNVVREEKISSTGGTSSRVYTHRHYLNDEQSNRFGFPTAEIESLDAGGHQVLSETSYVYDPATLDLLESRRLDDGRGEFLVTAYELDLYGNPIRITEPGGQVRHLTYDSRHRTFRTAESTRAGDHQPLLTTTWTYDPRFGVETSEIEPGGGFTTTSHDGFGRVVQVEQPHPVTGAPTVTRLERWLFTLDGLTVNETVTPLDWNGRQTIRRDHLDSLGRVVRTAFIGDDGTTRKKDTRYASSGRPLAQSKLYLENTAPVFETFSYDSLGRPLETVDGDGLRTRNTYQAPARVVSTIGVGTPHEKVRHLDYATVDGKKQVASVLHSNGQHIDFHYDVLGRLETARDSERGDLLRVTYDSLGRRTSVWNPEAGQVSMGYDAAGRLEHRTSQEGAAVSTFSYDRLGRVVRADHQAGGQTEQIDYGWDDASRAALGRLASVTSSGGFAYSYIYDATGRVCQQDVQIHGRTWTLQRSYDPVGRGLETVFPDGSRRRTAYDDSGLLSTVDFVEVDGITRRMVTVQDVQSDTRPSTLDLGVLRLELDWTTEGFITERHNRVLSGAWSETETIARTAGRWVDGITSSADPSQTFTYDEVGELTGASGIYPFEASSYTSSGDVLARGGVHFDYDHGRIVKGESGGVVVYAAGYDTAGRMTSRQVTAGPNVTSDALFYGARERLQRIERNGAVAATFLYDHASRRIYKNEGGVETFYVSRDYEETVHAGGAQQTRYVRSPEGGFATLSRGVATGLDGYPADGIRIVLTDHLGSVREIFDGDGHRETSLDYTPFGTLAHQIGGPARSRYGFAGMELDRSTGLLYDRARYYDPSVGRFITPDSRLGAGMLEFTAFNRYAYSGNDPLLFIDPSGHSWFSDAWDWASDHASAIASVVVDVAEVAAGVAITVASDGLLGKTFGEGLVSAGLGGLKYSATHFDDFEWKGWGEQEVESGLEGAAAGFLIGAAEARWGAEAIAGELAEDEVPLLGDLAEDAFDIEPNPGAGAMNNIVDILHNDVEQAANPGVVDAAGWNNLPQSSMAAGDAGDLFDLSSDDGSLAWVGSGL